MITKLIKNKKILSIGILAILAVATISVIAIIRSTNQMQQIENFQHTVTIETSAGNIKIETYDADAPLAVSNFIQLANEGFYNGLIFHRVINGFMIQGGCPDGTGGGGTGITFEDELNPNTESARKGYITGTVAMANRGPNTNDSQFFIMVANNPLPHLYTIFGRVIEGQEVANTISQVPTGGNDRPLEDITILRVIVEQR